MKNTLTIMGFVLSIIMLLSACSTANTKAVHSDRVVFDSTAELIEYIQTNSTVKSSIQSAYPSELKRSKSSDTISIFIPANEPVGYELSEIVLIGSNIYFSYSEDGYLQPVDKFSDEGKYVEERASTGGDITESATIQSRDVPSVSSEPDDAANQIQKNIEENGTIPNDYEAIEHLKNTITVGWNYTGNGSNGLDDFVNANSDVVLEFEGYSGVYYSDVVYPSDNILYGKMLYWVKDNYFFEAYIPVEEVSSIMSSTNGALNLAQPIQFSTKTFEAVS